MLSNWPARVRFVTSDGMMTREAARFTEQLLSDLIALRDRVSAIEKSPTDIIQPSSGQDCFYDDIMQPVG